MNDIFYNHLFLSIFVPFEKITIMQRFKISFQIILLSLICFSFSPLQAQKGYKISVKINNLRDSAIILAHHFSKSIIPDDTIYLDKNGAGIFKGDKALPQGMYLLFLPSKTYFDIMMPEDQDFYIENDTSDFVQNFKSVGSVDNEMFGKYQVFLRDNRTAIDALNKKYKAEENEKAKEKIRDEMKAIHETVKEKQAQFISDKEGSLFSIFVKATVEINVPDPQEEDKDMPDSVAQRWRYDYYRSHYFDNFDISDPRLLRTPFYNNKVDLFIEKVVPQIPDTIIIEVDKLIEASRGTEELFRNMLVNLFNKYAKSEIMCMDKVFMHIASKYYIPEATWSDSAFIKKLKKTVEEKKYVQCGEIVPDFQMVHVETNHFIEADGDTALLRDPYVGSFLNLHQINADYLVLIFWEADCGHCKKQVPQLYKIYQELKHKNVEFVALHMIGSREGKEKWINFVNSKEMYDWYNVWSPYSYEYKKLYDIKSTPVIYVLDKDKRIIAKRVGPEQIENILKHYLNIKD